jgi:Protein of unknown function (DUF1653)
MFGFRRKGKKTPTKNKVEHPAADTVVLRAMEVLRPAADNIVQPGKDEPTADNVVQPAAGKAATANIERPVARNVEKPATHNVVRSASGNFDVGMSDLGMLALKRGIEVGGKVGRYRITALALDSESKEPMVVYTDEKATWVKPLRKWRKK